jgi:chorismate synthase
MKIEKDHAEILNGVRHGLTLGSPITLLIENKDWPNWTEVMSAEPRDIAPEKSRVLKRPRPGHADLPGGLKYDVRDLRNILERASARETTARVACGALAKQLLAVFGIEIRSHVIQLGGIPEQPLELSWQQIAAIPDDGQLHCGDAVAEQKMIALIDETRTKGDTLGGIFEVVARGIIPAWLPHVLGLETGWTYRAGRYVNSCCKSCGHWRWGGNQQSAGL